MLIPVNCRVGVDARACATFPAAPSATIVEDGLVLLWRLVFAFLYGRGPDFPEPHSAPLARRPTVSGGLGCVASAPADFEFLLIDHLLLPRQFLS